MGAKVCPNQEASWSPFRDLPVLLARSVRRAALLRPAGHPRVHLAQALGGQAGALPAPTFTKDVLPIMQRSCQSCHRPGTPAPMSLMTFAEVRPWARSIKTKVTTREMPPWHIDRSIGEYANDPSLSDAEVATIAKWVDSGAPEGNRADAPPAKSLSAEHRVDLRRARSDRAHGEGLQDSRERPGLHSRRARRSETHRRPLREVGADHSRRVEGRAPRARLRRSARGHRYRRSRPRHGIERRQLDGSDRVRRRQRRRHFSGRLDEDPEEGIDLPLRGALSPVRRRTVRSDARRHQVLPEGLQAGARRHVASHSHRAG